MLKLDSLGLGKLQDIKTILTLANRGGLTLQDLIRTVNDEINILVAQYEKEHKLSVRASGGEHRRKDTFPDLRCPMCGQYARLLPVNIDAKTRVDGGYKSCGVCYNPNCLHTHYFKESVKEKMKQVGVVSE